MAIAAPEASRPEIKAPEVKKAEPAVEDIYKKDKADYIAKAKSLWAAAKSLIPRAKTDGVDVQPEMQEITYDYESFQMETQKVDAAFGIPNIDKPDPVTIIKPEDGLQTDEQREEDVHPDTQTETAQEQEEIIEPSTIKDYQTFRKEQGKPEEIDLSPEGIRKSQQEYIAWKKQQSEGYEHYDYAYTRALEPGRGNVFCHATSPKGAVECLASGYIKSASKVLEEGQDLRHAPANRVNTPPAFINEGLTFDKMTPDQQKQAKAWALNYVSGTLGKALEGYTGDSKDTALQMAIVYPLDAIKAKGVKFESHFPGSSGMGNGKEIDPYMLEKAQMNFKYLPNRSFSNHEGQDGAIEINIANKNEQGELKPTQIDTEGGIVLIREDKVEEIATQIQAKMELEGKTQESIKEAVNKIVGFSTEFHTVDEAVGWLTNTREGQAIIQQKTGIDISQLPQGRVNSDKEYVDDFILQNQLEIEGAKETAERLKNLDSNNIAYDATGVNVKIRKNEVKYKQEIEKSLKEKLRSLQGAEKTELPLAA